MLNCRYGMACGENGKRTNRRNRRHGIHRLGITTAHSTIYVMFQGLHAKQTTQGRLWRQAYDALSRPKVKVQYMLWQHFFDVSICSCRHHAHTEGDRTTPEWRNEDNDVYENKILNRETESVTIIIHCSSKSLGVLKLNLSRLMIVKKV